MTGIWHRSGAKISHPFWRDFVFPIHKGKGQAIIDSDKGRVSNGIVPGLIILYYWNNEKIGYYEYPSKTLR
jgi:hypothetical protein